VITGGQQPQLMFLAGTTGTGFLIVVDPSERSARVADLCSTLSRCFPLITTASNPAGRGHTRGSPQPTECVIISGA
jgi:hypothetical protein